MIGDPSGSLEVEPSNETVSGTSPVDGVAVARAIGARFVTSARTRRIVPPSRST